MIEIILDVATIALSVFTIVLVIKSWKRVK